ncbi:hypothetical protein WMO24_02890 [Ruthenibacterium sp. CLA-JM-H11]|uniref:ABC transporter permease n=1 Tax=Ruthenibacterium intestinale TaxID=3133163 RepID=A0ABV1GC95_9FIRM
MLSKLISHEAKRMGRLLLPVFGALLILSGVTRCMEAACLAWQGKTPLWLSIPTVFLLIGALLCAMVLPASSFLLSALHFYRMTGEEGYLLFSVPATIPQQIWAKLLSALVWAIAALGILVGCVWALVLQPFDMMDQVRGNMAPDWTGTWLGFYLFLLAVLVVLALAGSFLYVYLCCAVGMQFGANRLLATLVVYFGLPVVLQIVALFAVLLAGVALAAAGVFETLVTMPPTIVYAAFLGILTIVTLLWDVVCYAVTNHLLAKRLNLT